MVIPREQALVRACLRYLSARGCLIWRNNVGGVYQDGGPGRRRRFVRFGVPGLPDLVGYGPDGHGLAVECKRPGGRLTPAQRSFLLEAERRRVHALVCHSVDELLTWFAEHYGAP